MRRLYLSKQKMDDLKRLMPGKSFYFDELYVQSSPMLPFEITYNACDIESKMEVKIRSGEWVHGIIIPEVIGFIDLVPPKLSFAPEIIEEDRRTFLRSFMFKGRMF